jgi:cephalosporin hydroxylase
MEVSSSMAGSADVGVGVRNYRRLQIVEGVRRAVSGGDPQPLSQLRRQLRPTEKVLAKGLEVGLRAARWRRPASQGALLLGAVTKLLDQHFPASVTMLPIRKHQCILDALVWLEGPLPDASEGAPHAMASLDANPYLSLGQQRVVDAFHDLYYSLLNEGRGVETIRLSWLGTELLKCPMDLWLYQEIIAASRPDVIVETGTYRGGSAHYLATLCGHVGHGQVVSIDLNPWSDMPRPQHERLSYITGSSTDASVLAAVRTHVGRSTNVLVILDSDHTLGHVLAELRLYQQFISVGGLMVVEDTNVNGHPTWPEHGPGPWEAVDTFLKENPDFVADRGLERFLLTMNPRGYLRRIARTAASQG